MHNFTLLHSQVFNMLAVEERDAAFRPVVLSRFYNYNYTTFRASYSPRYSLFPQPVRVEMLCNAAYLLNTGTLYGGSGLVSKTDTTSFLPRGGGCPWGQPRLAKTEKKVLLIAVNVKIQFTIAVYYLAMILDIQMTRWSMMIRNISSYNEIKFYKFTAYSEGNSINDDVTYKTKHQRF